MELTNQYLYNKMVVCQQLLWGGSETENIEAHNIIAKLIVDMEDQKFHWGRFQPLRSVIK